jgi:HTH-type transcriptional regulator/antitoxin HigA
VNPSSGAKNDREREADAFASDTLIPRASYKRFTASSDLFSANSVEAFARDIEVDPSIVVGRLQHDSLLPHSRLNERRRRFEIVSV